MNSSTSLAYRMPPQVIADLVDAPLTPSVSIGPNQDWMLIMAHPGLPPIKELSQPELRLAGLRINPRTNGQSRSSYFTALTLKQISDGSERPITGLPEGACVGNVSWSPDGARIGFTLTRDSGIELWVAEVDTAQAIQVTTAHLNGVYGSPFCWLSDSLSLLCRAVPPNRSPIPKAPTVPSGPVVQENIGVKTPAWTYQDLLKRPYDEALFEYYSTSQILRFTLSGESTPIASQGIISEMKPSPNGKYILVVTIHRPFS